jgi:hypothetical protein
MQVKELILTRDEYQLLISLLHKLSNSSDSVIKAHANGLKLKIIDELCDLNQEIRF